jgi:hypothetical protein
MMTTAGLRDVEVRPGTTLWQDSALAVQLLFLEDAVQTAVRRGLDLGVARGWMLELERRGAEGTFFASATGFLVTGRKP